MHLNYQGTLGRCDTKLPTITEVVPSVIERGADNPDVAHSLNNLAELYRTQGHYALAEPLLKQALALNEQALGPDRPNVATGLHNLAVLYRATKRDREAAILGQRAARSEAIQR